MKRLVKLALLTMSTAGSAAGQQLTAAGNVELAGNVSFSHYDAAASDFSTSVFTFAPQVSYFWRENFSLGLSTGFGYLSGVSVVSPSDGDNSTVVQLFAAPAYHFQLDSKQLVPFVEGQLGYGVVTSGDSSSGLSYGARAGVKFVPVDHLVLTLAAQFLSLRLYRSDSDERIGWDYWTLGVGVGGYF